jgi:hypothetical protein
VTIIANSRPVKGPLPLVIGVTGHRDLRPDDIPYLEASVEKIFSELQEKYPSTPLTIITGLAEGSDRLVARTALSLGMTLIVPLPLSLNEYRKDFLTESSQAEFEYLIARSAHVFELPLIHDCEEHEVATPGPKRNHHYAQLGAYIATHAQLLLALWDGEGRTLVGGTSQVVQYKLEGVPEPFVPEHSPLDAAETGPVYHIITPRASSHEEPSHPFSVHIRYPEGYDSKQAAKHAFDDIYERMEVFNKDSLRLSASLKDIRHKSKEYVLRKEHHPELTSEERSVLDLYSVTDSLAIHYQRSTHRTLRVLLFFVFVAAFFLDIYSQSEHKEPLMLLPYLLTFVAAFGWYYIAKRGAYQSKYLDYRAFAEGLRVQFFWLIAGMHESVPDYYMRKQKSELDWIRHGIRTSRMSETSHPTMERARNKMKSEQERGLRLERVEKFWIVDQTKYYSKAYARDHKKLTNWEKRITLFFALGLVGAGVQVLLRPQEFLLTLAPVVAALFGAYLEKNALAEHTKQYERMSALFNRARQHMHQLLESNLLSEAERFVIELGKEALSENGDWLLTHRDRPIEVPKGA